MNDDCRKIFEMLAALNARLEMNEHLTRQMDEQLALLNLKREEELEELRSTLKNLTAAFAAMTSELAQKSDVPPIVQDNSALAKTSDDLQAIRAAVEELKIALKNSSRADDFVTIRMALQNTSVAINDIKKRVDGIKFDTSKKFNELALNSEINHKALAAAVSEIKTEVAKIAAAFEPEPDPDFEVSTWWSGNKER